MALPAVLVALVTLPLTAHVGAGIAAFMLGNGTDARLRRERALILQPRYTDASRVLGLVPYRVGKLSEAIHGYEEALQCAPGGDTWRNHGPARRLSSRAGSMTRDAHFAVKFEGPTDDAITNRIVEILERAYWRIGSALATYPTETITVVLYLFQLSPRGPVCLSRGGRT